MADAAIAELGDKLAGLTIKQAVELKDYLKETYQIEPAAGGGGGGGGGAAAAPVAAEEAQTNFDVVLKSSDPTKKIAVIKEVPCSDWPWSEGSQGPRRRRPEDRQRVASEGRGREAQEDPRGRRRRHRAQVNFAKPRACSRFLENQRRRPPSFLGGRFRCVLPRSMCRLGRCPDEFSSCCPHCSSPSRHRASPPRRSRRTMTVRRWPRSLAPTSAPPAHSTATRS